jgi:hypothetical protein
MTDDDLKHRRLVDKTLESSTTIENLKDIKLGGVEYTQASGNGKLLLE